MSRSPINVELRALKTPRERVWEAILQLGASPESAFDRETIQDHCNPMVSLSLVTDYTDDLLKAGYLKRVSGSGGRRGVLQTPLQLMLVRRQAEGPRISVTGAKVTQGRGTAAMWRAMKVLPSFDYIDIAKAATLDTLVVTPQTSKDYVVHLARAGYLTTLEASKPGVPARHRLEMNTGPLAPAITRCKWVFDRNLGIFADANCIQRGLPS